MASFERVVTKKRLTEAAEPWRSWLTRPADELGASTMGGWVGRWN